MARKGRKERKGGRISIALCAFPVRLVHPLAKKLCSLRASSFIPLRLKKLLTHSDISPERSRLQNCKNS